MNNTNITPSPERVAPEINNDLAAPVRITTRARAEITEALEANKIPATYGLRIGLRGGGCGATFLLGFDLPAESDQLYEVAGVRVIIDRRHLMYVLGAQIDYEENDEQAGFTIAGSGQEAQKAG